MRGRRGARGGFYDILKKIIKHFIYIINTQNSFYETHMIDPNHIQV